MDPEILAQLQCWLRAVHARAVASGALFHHTAELSWTQDQRLYDCVRAAVAVCVEHSGTVNDATGHVIMNSVYPLAPRYSPVFIPPTAPGEYWYAHAYSAVPMRAMWRRSKWVYPTDKSGVYMDVPVRWGDRWAPMPGGSTIDEELVRVFL